MSNKNKKRQNGGHGPNAMYLGQKASNPKETIRRLGGYLSPYIIHIIIVSLTVILSTIASLSIFVIFGYAIDKYIKTYNDTGVFDYNGIFTVAMIMLGIGVLVGVLRYYQNYMMAYISQKAICKIRQDAFDKLQNLPVSYTDKNNKGEILSTLTNDIDVISNVLSEAMIQLVTGVLTIVGAGIAMFIVSWQLAIITIVFVPIMIILVMFITKKTFKNFKAQQQRLGELNNIIEETVPAIKTIKLYNQEETVVNEFKVKNMELRKAGFKAMLYGGFIMPLMGFMNNVIFVFIAAIGAYLAISLGVVTVGAISTTVMLSRQFTFPIQNIAQLMNSVQRAIAGAERVFNLIDEKDEYQDDKDLMLDKVAGAIEFKDVYFSYEEGKDILKDITFSAKAGEMIAIVGPTGSGKTTIINLLNRFYDVQKGQITLDGHDLYSIKKDNLRSKVGIVLQDTKLFVGTVADNIRYGKMNATMEEIIAVAKEANADGFISRLPNGYNSKVEDGGSNFSQGERQLISIARTMLSNPEVLILDEATSNVDTRTEAHIQQSMHRIMQNRTSFVIAHRLQTIRKADKILVLKDGEIIERGSHEELLEQQGFYHDLYIAQFAGQN